MVQWIGVPILTSRTFASFGERNMDSILSSKSLCFVKVVKIEAGSYSEHKDMFVMLCLDMVKD